MLHIGMIGPDFLLQRNHEIFQQQQVDAFAITDSQQIAQIDGLLITGWQPAHYTKQLQQLQFSITQCADALSLLGISAGIAALGRNNPLAVMDCDIFCQPAPAFTTAVLEMPGITQQRFPAWFFPQIRFCNLAPCMGILCQHSRHGPVIVRQGNFLACSYVAERTANNAIYHYWLEMVAALKNSRDF